MSEFKVGDKVVLKSSSQDKVMVIQDYLNEFIRAYWDKKHYSFAHESNFRPASPAEEELGHRIDEPLVKSRFSFTSEQAKRIGDCQLKRYMELAETLGDDFPIENHISPNCKAKDV